MSPDQRPGATRPASVQATRWTTDPPNAHQPSANRTIGCPPSMRSTVPTRPSGWSKVRTRAWPPIRASRLTVLVLDTEHGSVVRLMAALLGVGWWTGGSGGAGGGAPRGVAGEVAAGRA